MKKAEHENWLGVYIQGSGCLVDQIDLKHEDCHTIDWYQNELSNCSYLAGFLARIIEASHKCIDEHTTEMLKYGECVASETVTTRIETLYWQDSRIVGAFMWMAGAISWPIRIVVGSALQLLSDLYRLAQDIIYTLLLLTLLIVDIAHEVLISAVGYCEAVCDGIERAQSVLKNSIMRLTIAFDTCVSRALGSNLIIIFKIPGSPIFSTRRIKNEHRIKHQKVEEENPIDLLIKHQKFEEENLIDLSHAGYIRCNTLHSRFGRLIYETIAVSRENTGPGNPKREKKVTYRSLV